MKEIIKLLITIFLMISAFFIGIWFNDSVNQKLIKELENKKYNVTITITKDKVKVEKPDNINVIVEK